MLSPRNPSSLYIRTENIRLCVVVMCTFSKGDELDGASTTITFEDLNTLDGLWKDLRDEGISIEHSSLEHLGCWYLRGYLRRAFDHSHIRKPKEENGTGEGDRRRLEEKVVIRGLSE